MLWDTATGELLRTFLGHPADVDAVAFSPDGRWILSGSADATLRLWDPATGKLVRTFVGHDDGVGAVGFGPNGRAIVSASYDGTLRLWDKDTTRWLAQLVSLRKDDRDYWLCLTAPGYFTCSPGAEQFLTVRRRRTNEVEPVMRDHANLKDPKAVAKFLSLVRGGQEAAGPAMRPPPSGKRLTVVRRITPSRRKRMARRPRARASRRLRPAGPSSRLRWRGPIAARPGAAATAQPGPARVSCRRSGSCVGR